jgi:hypothetical protein
MFTEYEKAIDSLTINEENRLRKKVAKLQMDKSEMDYVKVELERIKKIVMSSSS